LFYFQNNITKTNTANPPVEAMARLLGTDTISKGRELTFKVERLTKVAGIFKIEGGPRATRS
jgi:hypothetical protein